MCGIAGIFSKEKLSILTAKTMNDKLIHRGPDGYGYLSSSEVSAHLDVDQHVILPHFNQLHFILMHRRLAINDLSEAGHQPMSYLDKYWLVFNGEIYNFIELREELKAKGYAFKSQTDSEVIMAAYDCWGSACLNKFNGDWAFVLIDTSSQKIFISRDRFGIKPLYYFIKPGFFLFASEIKALLAHPKVNKEPNLDYLKTYIKEGPKEYERETAFKDIFRFDFASYFEGDLDALLNSNTFMQKKFWQLSPNLSTEPLKENELNAYKEKYYTLLKDAVKIRLRSDVKVGASLSGGLDSSSIVYLMNQFEDNPFTKKLETFSSVYQTPGTENCDESALINEIASYLFVKSNQIEPQIKDIPKEHRKMIYHMDNPPESTLMSSWHTAKLTRAANVTVTLSGEGADEQLAGYFRYLTYHFSNMRLRKARASYVDFKNTPIARSYIRLGVLANTAKKILGKKFTQYLYGKSGRKEKIFTPVNKKLSEDIFTCLVNLHHIDERAFMAFSVEQRAPFMDYRLVEFLASIPISYKLAKGWTKYLARYTFKEILPFKINWSKTKLGWPVPEQFWFEGELKSWLKTTIQHSIFLKKYQLMMIKNYHKTSLTERLRLLNLAVWHEVFFEDVQHGV